MAPRWRLRGSATSVRGRRRLGVELASDWRHGSGRRRYQKREQAMLNMMLTEIAKMRGGKVVGDEVVRRRL